MITYKSPAKINLTLEVLGKRADGYHEIRSVMQTVSLNDIMDISLGEKDDITCDYPDWQAEKSLLPKAMKIFREQTGFAAPLNIGLKKNIPLMAGLGGDSSNAATILLAMNELSGLGLGNDKLAGMARQLGSDVTFFLFQGTCVSEGRGEIIHPFRNLPEMQVLLIRPDVKTAANKTAAAYGRVCEQFYTQGEYTRNLMKDLEDGTDISSGIFNVFENTEFMVGNPLDTARKHLLKMGIPWLKLAGSGPCMFYISDSDVEITDYCKMISNQNMTAWHLKTTPGIR